MEFNRNQFYMIGLVLLLLGAEFRLVNKFVLNSEATQMLAKRAGHPIAAVNNAAQTLLQTDKPLPMVKKSLQPPDWLGWALVSIGSVLVLHSFSLPKPGG